MQSQMTSALDALFTSGRVADLILALLAVEVAILFIYHRTTGRGIAPIDLIMNNLAGAGLVLALRSALTGGAWTSVGAWLAAAFVAHISDVIRRWR